jgi:NAD(P)H-dependent flavin oxidoreductase YrpB (nitropropane dioxygenase family)
MKTAVTEMFDVEFPIFAFSHCRDVVAAVSRAGGVGVLGAAFSPPEDLDVELKWITEHADGKPFGVDLLMPRTFAGSVGGGAEPSKLLDAITPAHRKFVLDVLAEYGVEPPDAPEQRREGGDVLNPLKHAERLIDVAFSHPIALVASGLGPPTAEWVDAARTHGVHVAALAGRVDHARRSIEAGADLIIAQGYEAGGHTGEIASMVLIPEVVDAVAPVPVLGAGGIGRGRQMAAAMALGAEGVWCGSVWLTTEEAETHPVVKEKFLAAGSADTVRSRGRTGKPARQLRSAWTEAWERPDSPGTLPMPLQTFLAEPALRKVHATAQAHPDSAAKQLATYYVGQIVGSMNSEKKTSQVVYELIEEFVEAVERLDGITGTG